MQKQQQQQQQQQQLPFIPQKILVVIIIIIIIIFFVIAIVEFEEWSIASIIWVGRSRRGVKTLLWLNYRINYQKLCYSLRSLILTQPLAEFKSFVMFGYGCPNY